MSKKRVLDLLTNEQLIRIQELKRHILRSTTNAEIRYYRKEFDEIIKNAKAKYCQERDQTV